MLEIPKLCFNGFTFGFRGFPRRMNASIKIVEYVLSCIDIAGNVIKDFKPLLPQVLCFFETLIIVVFFVRLYIQDKFWDNLYIFS